MRLRKTAFCLVLLASGLGSGCVERRFIVESNAPGAKVYVNNEPVGYAPVDVPFTYYGRYNITLQRDGFQTETFQENLKAPWYAYPPIDFFAEHIWPAKIRDVRTVVLEMKPTAPPNLDEIRNEAEDLRAKGQDIPDPVTEGRRRQRGGPDTRIPLP